MTKMLEISKQSQKTLPLNTGGQGLYEITGEVAGWTMTQKVTMGILTVYCRHTSASLIIQENADPAVMEDLQNFFRRLVPEDGTSYTHSSEGPDDMPAHIKGALTSTFLNIPVSNGCLALGRWQGIFFFEHRLNPRPRQIILHLMGS